MTYKPHAQAAAPGTQSDTHKDFRMDLLLWRHAEAEAGFPDSERKLTPRGEKQAKQMAEWIRRHAPKNLRIISSPAVRCQQTAKALERPFEVDQRLDTNGDVSSLLAAAGWPSSIEEPCQTVIVIGHQPTRGQTAALLLSGHEANWTIKKGAMWWFVILARQGNSHISLRAVIGSDLPNTVPISRKTSTL